MLAAAFTSNAEIARSASVAQIRPTVATDPLAHRMASGPVRMVEAKDHIFREGDRVTHVYKVEVGHVCIYKTMPDGRRQVIDFAYPGDMIGLGALHEHAANAQAMARTRVHCLPIATLQRAVQDDAQLGIELCQALSRELLASQEMLMTVSQRTAIERVAAFLVALSRRNQRNGEDPKEFVLPMTRNDIADFLGLTIETVSRTFTKLRSDGVIDLGQSILVTIVDPQRLSEVAEGRCH